MGNKEELESQACVEKRERLFRKLQITFDLLKNLPNEENVFLARAQKVEDEYKLFNEVQDKIARLNLVIETRVTVDSVSEAYENLYYKIIAQRNSILDSKSKANEVSVPVTHEVKQLRPKLPPINIPKFKGDLEKFPAFKSLFDTLVHDTGLSNIQKFSFLKSYLEYPALSVIDNFDFTDDNYEAAYNKLVKRYTDKRLVGTHYLNKLLQFKPLSNSSPNNLRQFMDVFCVQYESLKVLQIPDLADFVVFNLGMKVLDPDTKRLFEDKHCKKDFPTFSDLLLFVTEQYKVASIVQAPSTSKQSTNPYVTSSRVNSSQGHKQSLATKSLMSNFQEPQDTSWSSQGIEQHLENAKCPLCKHEHKLSSCEEFSEMTPVKRFETVKSLKLCFACLGPHPRSSCKSKFSCRSCKNRNHHSMLHRDQQSMSKVQNVKSKVSTNLAAKDVVTKEVSTNALSCHVKSEASPATGLLGTVCGRILSSSGDWINCRMVVDPASESSFITESLVQSLRLPRRKYSIDVVGVGSSKLSTNRGCVSCSIVPRHRDDPLLSVEAIILPTISSNMPKLQLDVSLSKRFHNLQLADPDFDKPGAIDLLLGVQHFSDILSDNCVHIKGQPAALDTVFGFLIFGKIPSTQSTSVSTSLLTQTPPLEDLIRRFWESEEAVQVIPVNSNDIVCEKFFQETTTRDSQGRYQVSLPFKDGKPPENLGSTRQVAQQRLIQLEKRLSKNPHFKGQYNENLEDYVTQDHMRPTSKPVDYLLTHHAVVKASSTTQVRVVFNASEKSNTAKSLNDYLLPGPKLQSDISHILLSFRMNPIALTGDIKQMYRCIRLNPIDTQYTHLLWRKDSNLPITEWELTTLPFGLTCSPYIAQRTLKQLISDDGGNYSMASKALNCNIYIDDVVCAVPTEDEAVKLYHELTDLLGKGGFSLRKFSSNSGYVLSHIPEDHQETPVSFDSTDCIKLLGLLWDPASDQFCYKINLEHPVNTKRGILSQVARIYDINGYLTPVTFSIKYFIQRMWLAGISWDEQLPPPLEQLWIEFYSQLGEIKKITIPRNISFPNASDITIIGFSDASEKGYGACVYLRVSSPKDGVQVNILKAKSKVAPLKTQTIPRLELNGALLLSKIMSSLKDFLSHLPSFEVLCFTDSTTVLSWLHMPPHQLKTYISNRVVQILDVLPPNVWKHIPGKYNPADMASRGLNPVQLVENKFWWNGPEFLTLPCSQWPKGDFIMMNRVPECKEDSLSLLSKVNQENTKDHFVDGLLHTYSSFTKVQRVLSYVIRFTSNLRLKLNKRKFGELTQPEMTNALKVLVRFTQQKHCHETISQVKNGSPIKGYVRHLTPCLSDDGLLMVGGRLNLAPISSKRKNPYLIPRRSRLAHIICSHYHRLTLHGGPQLMQSLIQRQFWIPGIRYILRSVVFNCIDCYRFKAKPLEPLMSDVPSFRFCKTRAFVNTGVDLAGPYLYKESKRRNAKSFKCWIVLYICLSTRAVYIDLVSDLSTAAFLSSLDRFISRRGLPSSMYSDLGTNFVGAARELKDIFDVLMQGSEHIKNFCGERQINWQFNPPSAPNFGGSWESAIKSMKHHLKRTISNRPLTYEEYSTLLARIEAIMNSRPLCPVSTSPSDGFDYLTPGHFLVGAPLLLSRPEPDYLSQPIDLRSRWQLISQSVQDFWRRWSQEYVHTLIQRPKWDNSTPNLEPGKMILLSEKNLPPTSWSIGRVIEVYPGPDGVVRVAKIKTPSGTFTRPVNKLCVLPFQD